MTKQQSFCSLVSTTTTVFLSFFLFLFQPADIYLIDEPSAYLDSEQRLVAAKVIKRSVRAVWGDPPQA